MKINIVGHKVKTDHALISTKTIQFSAHWRTPILQYSYSIERMSIFRSFQIFNILGGAFHNVWSSLELRRHYSWCLDLLKHESLGNMKLKPSQYFNQNHLHKKKFLLRSLGLGLSFYTIFLAIFLGWYIAQIFQYPLCWKCQYPMDLKNDFLNWSF